MPDIISGKSFSLLGVEVEFFLGALLDMKASNFSLSIYSPDGMLFITTPIPLPCDSPKIVIEILLFQIDDMGITSDIIVIIKEKRIRFSDSSRIFDDNITVGTG